MQNEEFLENPEQVKSLTKLRCQNFSSDALNVLSGILMDEDCKIETLYLLGNFEYNLNRGSQLYQSLTLPSCTVRNLMINTENVSSVLEMVANSYKGFVGVYTGTRPHSIRAVLFIDKDSAVFLRRAALKIQQIRIRTPDIEVCETLFGSQITTMEIELVLINSLLDHHKLAIALNLITRQNSITRLRIENPIYHYDLMELALSSPFCRLKELGIRCFPSKNQYEGFTAMFARLFLRPENQIETLSYTNGYSSNWIPFIDTLTKPECKIRTISLKGEHLDESSVRRLCEKLRTLEIKSVRKIKLSRNQAESQLQINEALIQAANNRSTRSALGLLEGVSIRRINTRSSLQRLPADMVRRAFRTNYI